jgi:hypothetical protein
LLLVLFALLALGARRLSLTIDEPMHLTAGYALLARGQDALWLVPARGHPLLVNAWEALPIYVGQPDLPLERMQGWQEYHIDLVLDFVARLVPLEAAEMAGRVPEMLLAVLLAAVVFRWAIDLSAAGGALLALGFLVFDPTLLAHGRLATNDVGVVALGTLALYVGWRWWHRPTWRRAIAAGLLFATTMLAKGSGALWLAAFGLSTIGLGLVERRPGRFWGQAVTLGAVALIGLWAAYGFSVGQVADLSIPFPAPHHWQALIEQGQSPGQRVTFALGTFEVQGWWYYLLAFLIKNPVPFLVGIGASAVTLVWKRPSWRTLLTLAMFPLVYLAVAIAWGGAVGYRHLLPLHPFLYLCVAAGLSRWLRGGRRWVRWALLGLALWMVVGTVGVFPDEIAFFNELVGGPEQGYRYLVDSNLDWGQSFKELRDWLDANPGPRPGIAHLTYVDPARYGIDHVALEPGRNGQPISPPYRPAPGRYVVGATPLQGVVAHRVLPPGLRWFRYAEPTARVGHALFVYQVTPYEGEWLAQCTDPVVPLSQEAVATGFGQVVPREVRFDCRESWIYPMGAVRPGWYALHGYLFPPDGLAERLLYRLPQPGDAFVTRHVARSRLSYRRRSAAQLPPFALYEAAAPPELPRDDQVYATASTTAPSALSGGALSVPVALDGPLAFLGAEAYAEDSGLEVETWWRVTEGSIDRAFSIMGHLSTPDGETLEVADGLGVSPLALVAGDVIVQRHRFGQRVEAGELWLRTGAYWLDTMSRWEVAGRPGTNTLVVRLVP